MFGALLFLAFLELITFGAVKAIWGHEVMVTAFYWVNGVIGGLLLLRWTVVGISGISQRVQGDAHLAAGSSAPLTFNFKYVTDQSRRVLGALDVEIKELGSNDPDVLRITFPAGTTQDGDQLTLPDGSIMEMPFPESFPRNSHGRRPTQNPRRPWPILKMWNESMPR